MAMHIRSYSDFKAAITDSVEAGGGTRASFAKELEARGALRAHTVCSLLSTAPVLGRRKPSFDSVLKLAHAAGFDLSLTPQEH